MTALGWDGALKKPPTATVILDRTGTCDDYQRPLTCLETGSTQSIIYFRSETLVGYAQSTFFKSWLLSPNFMAIEKILIASPAL